MIANSIHKIMLVTNEAADARAAERSALHLANRTDAVVLLVDSVRMPLSLPRVPSITTELMLEAAIDSKQAYLNTVAARFRKHGIEVETEVLRGPRTSESISNRATTSNCDLVIRYAKGGQSRTQRRFGQTARNLIRVCPCPVLFVDQREVPAEAKILACIHAEHSSLENQAILDAARRLAKFDDRLHALYCWDFSPSLYLTQYIDEGLLEQTNEDAESQCEQIFDTLQEKYDLSDFSNRFAIEMGDPQKVIPAHAKEHDVDVVVMSNAALNHPLGRLMGSTIESVIDKLHCALLVTKPHGFESPLSPTSPATASVTSFTGCVND